MQSPQNEIRGVVRALVESEKSVDVSSHKFSLSLFLCARTSSDPWMTFESDK